MSFAKPTKLTSRIVDDDEQLAQVIESHIRTYCRHTRQQRDILRLQSKLQRLVNPEAWAVYLKFEDAVIYRDNRIREDLVRWAFRAGVRSRRRRQPSRR